MDEQSNVVNTEVEQQDSTTTDSTPAENNSPEVAADEVLETLKSDDDSPSVNDTETDKPEEPEAPKEEVQDDPKEEETETEEKPRGKAEERKQQLNQEIRGLVEQRKAIKEEVERLNQIYQAYSPEELQQQGLNPEEARLTALEQQVELDRYNNQVVEAQMTLNEQAERVVKEFPIFDENSPEFDQELFQEAQEALAASLITDPNTGQIIGSHLSPYQIYKPIADAYEKAKTRGQISGQKATEQMLARADGQTSSAPQAPKEDPILAILKSDD